jgi:hypothetical protein
MPLSLSDWAEVRVPGTNIMVKTNKLRERILFCFMASVVYFEIFLLVLKEKWMWGDMTILARKSTLSVLRIATVGVSSWAPSVDEFKWIL